MEGAGRTEPISHLILWDGGLEGRSVALIANQGGDYLAAGDVYRIELLGHYKTKSTVRGRERDLLFENTAPRVNISTCACN